VRRFEDRDVSDDQIKSLLEAALWAPYAFQRQIFIVVRNAQTKRALVGKFYDENRNLHIATAPVDIVACVDLRKQDWHVHASLYHGKPDHRELFSIQESSAMIENMLLTAHELGLAGCWNGTFDEEHVREVLHAPPGVRPVAIVSIGYPAHRPRPPARKTLEQVLHKEGF